MRGSAHAAPDRAPRAVHAAAGRGTSLVVHAVVLWNIRLVPLADPRLHLPPDDASLVYRCPALVRRTVDDLAYRGDGDRAVDRYFARRKSSQGLIAITAATDSHHSTDSKRIMSQAERVDSPPATRDGLDLRVEVALTLDDCQHCENNGS